MFGLSVWEWGMRIRMINDVYLLEIDFKYGYQNLPSYCERFVLGVST